MSQTSVAAGISVAPSDSRNVWFRSIGILLVLFAAAIPALASSSPFLLVLATHAAIAAIVALSLDLLIGTVGLIAFGHAAWYGAGAYAGGLFAKHGSAEMLLVLPATAAMAAAASVLIGLVFVRQVGKSFAILTLALSQILFAAVFVFSQHTGGEDGLQEIPIPTLFGHPINNPAHFYWLILAILLASVAVAFILKRSPFGQSCAAVKANADRSRFIGLNTNRLKLAAYVLSAILASVGGCLHSLYTSSASPDILHWVESGKILMYVVLGGVGTIIGPVIGAVVFTISEHYVSTWSDEWHIYFGAIFIVAVIAAPGGLYGAIRDLACNVLAGRKQQC